MYNISHQQIAFILNDLRVHGIQIESLRYELLDHICIVIEQNLEEGDDFETFYASAIKTFYTQELREIEEETVFQLTFGRHLALSRNQFFLLLFAVFIGPFFGYDITWLVTSGQSSGWNLPFEIWGSTLVFSVFPLMVLLVLFFTPERLDPLIPKRSKVLLGIRPLIKIVS